MQPLEWERRPDGLRAPAIVCAFKGWNDAGDAASTAAQFVGTSLGATRFASIDPEEFYDFQTTRPQVRVDEQGVREITWPAIEVYEARVPRAPRDLVLVVGHEPSLRWRTFCQLVVDLAEALGAQLLVSLGALLADLGHGDRVRPLARRPARRDVVVLRGPDRDRRRAAGRVHESRAAGGEPVGGGAALHRERAEPEGGARARAQARRPRRRDGRRLRARARGARLRAPGQPRRAERPRRPGVRRAPGARRRRGGGPARPPRPPLRRPHRQRVPALPQAARRGLSEQLCDEEARSRIEPIA